MPPAPTKPNTVAARMSVSGTVLLSATRASAASGKRCTAKVVVTDLICHPQVMSETLSHSLQPETTLRESEVAVDLTAAPLA